MTALLLVDDHASSRQPLALLLTLTLTYDEIRQAGTIEEAKALMAGIDVAIIDLGLPDGDGATLIRSVLSAEPAARILVLTSSSDRLDAARAIAAGAHGVLHKAADIDTIVAAVQAIRAGEKTITPEQRDDLKRIDSVEMQRRIGAPHLHNRLTPREQDVLQCLADGLSDKEIAFRLGIGVETVRTHLASIYGKLGVESRLQALAFALHYGLVSG